jgi:predicted MFS family arabinose efflux permease
MESNEKSTWVQGGLFIFIRIVLSTSQRMVYPFLAVFARGLGISVAQLSYALTSRGLIGFISPFLAPVSDKYGRKAGMLTGLGVFIVGNAIVVIKPSLVTFILATSLVVLGIDIYLPAIYSFVSDKVDYERRGRVLALIEMGWALSFMLGIPAAGLLIESYGWLAPFPALALMGLLMFGITLKLVPDHDKPATSEQGNLWSGIVRVLRHPVALAMLGSGFFLAFANEVVSLYFGVWLENSFQLQVAALGAASAVIGFAELSGETLTAGLVDRIGKKTATIIGLVLNGIFALLLPWLGQTLPGAYIGLFLFYLTFEFSIVCSLPLATEIMPEARAALLGLDVMVFAFGRMLAAAIAPSLFNWGFVANCVAACMLNILSLILLARVKLVQQPAQNILVEGS